MSASNPRGLARSLGVASVGLGVPMLAAPGRVSRLSGVDDSASSVPVIRLVGARELVHAAGLLAGKSRWAWTRVGGDALDLLLLARAVRSRDGVRRRRALLSTAAVAGIAAVDVYTAVRSRPQPPGPGITGTPALQLRASVTVTRGVGEVYDFWRDLTHLPQFMAHLQKVEVLSGGRSHWVAAGPAGSTVEWEAEATEDVPGQRLAWRSLPGAQVPNEGEVTFAPAPREDDGTEVRVTLSYAPPGGRLGRLVAKMLGEEPEQQVRDDLRRLKQVLETGHVVRSAASPEGTKALRQLKQRPAQPLPAGA